MTDLNRYLAEKMGFKVEFTDKQDEFLGGNFPWLLIDPKDGVDARRFPSPNSAWHNAPDYTESWEAMGELLEWAGEQGMWWDMFNEPLKSGEMAYLFSISGVSAHKKSMKHAVAEAVARALGWEG